MEGGSNLGDGKNGGNYISGSDMPTNNVDLVDQHCRDISGWAVTQRSQVPYIYHLLIQLFLRLDSKRMSSHHTNIHGKPYSN